MYDPYKVLGIDRTATEEEVKKAYRGLSRRYHPDANVNNPNKDKAEEKFKEIQQAYQQIMNERERGQSGGFGGYGRAGNSDSGGFGGYGGFGGFGGFGDFGGFGNRETQGADEETIRQQAAINYIRSGHYKEALNVLNSLARRDARWFYLSGIANSGVGNNVTALEHARQAVNLEPGNLEYQQLVQQLSGGGGWYHSRREPYGGFGAGQEGYCSKLCFTYLLCNLCCGGGMCCGGPYGYYR